MVFPQAPQTRELNEAINKTRDEGVSYLYKLLFISLGVLLE
jgi:hypothetical protein